MHLNVLRISPDCGYILGPYILISYGESPHEIEAANQYWPINE